MDKKIFYIVVGTMVAALIILVIAVSILNSRKNPSEQLNQQQTNSLINTADENIISPEVTSSVEESGPEQSAIAFYNWYISTPNPLGSGQYINSPYLSPDYKDSIKGFVVRGDHLDSDPVLTCVGVEPPKKITVQPPVYDTSRLKASVNLQEETEGSKALYEMILANIEQKWLIEDVRCVL